MIEDEPRDGGDYFASKLSLQLSEILTIFFNSFILIHLSIQSIYSKMKKRKELE